VRRPTGAPVVVIPVLLVVAVVLLAVTSCTDGRGSDTAVPSTTAAPPATVDGTIAPGAATSIAALPPVADRWTYLSEPVTVEVPGPVPEAERGELERLRAEAAVPFPPGDDRMTRVGEGTPTRYADLTVDVGRRRTLNPLRMARLLSLVAVAGHEAAVAAARTPSPGAPMPRDVDPSLAAPLSGVDAVGVELPAGQLPPEVVTSAAQRTVACALVPDECPRFERLDAIARRRLVASGAAWPSTIDASVRLGEAVAAAVLARAEGDGAAPWTASPTDVSPGGEWVPTPGMFTPALEPFAGTWRPWNLTSGDQFRPDPPPAAGSPEHDAAVAQVLAEGTNLSDRDLRVAAYWDLGPGTSTPPGYWISDITADALRQAPVADQASGLALVATSMFDAGVATWDAKYAYRSVRPVTVIRSGASPQWLPSLVTPPFPAYVSGHSAFTAAAAETMSVLRPERAEEFLDAAAEASDSRLLGGIHYWFDLTEGATLGQQVGRAALERAGVQPVADARPVRERITYVAADVRSEGRQ
jgi:membrane-associated phospholipid phosphatase